MTKVKQLVPEVQEERVPLTPELKSLVLSLTQQVQNLNQKAQEVATQASQLITAYAAGKGIEQFKVDPNTLELVVSKRI